MTYCCPYCSKPIETTGHICPEMHSRPATAPPLNGTPATTGAQIPVSETTQIRVTDAAGNDYYITRITEGD